MSETGRRPAPHAAVQRARWILVAPFLLFAAVFIVYPVYQGVQTGFYGLSLRAPDTPFVGLDNFTAVLTDRTFWTSIRFTLLFSVVVTAIEGLLGFGLALLVHRAFPGKRLLFTLLLLPLMVAPALWGVMFRLLLNGDIGLVSEVLRQFGWGVSLFAPESVVPLLVVVDVIQWTPFTFLVMYAGLQSFPRDLIEAAQIDGAPRWRTLWDIVIPILRPVLLAAVLLRLLDAIRTFDVIYVLTAGGPGTSTTTMSIWIYKTGFESGRFGVAAAAATLIVIGLLPFVPLMVRRIVDAGAVGDARD